MPSQPTMSLVISAHQRLYDPHLVVPLSRLRSPALPHRPRKILIANVFCQCRCHLADFRSSKKTAVTSVFHNVRNTAHIQWPRQGHL